MSFSLPENKITNFNKENLQKWLDLTYEARSSMHHHRGNLLFSRKISKFEQPCFYILRDESDDKTLYIIVRGSKGKEDTLTDLCFNEIEDELGFFYHSGFYHSASDVFGIVQQYVEEFSTIYLIGHSLGGSVVTILHVLMSRRYPEKDINTIAHDPAPSLERASILPFESKIATIVFRNEIASSLSAPNIHQRLKWFHWYYRRFNPDKAHQRIHTFLQFLPALTQCGRGIQEIIDFGSLKIYSALSDLSLGDECHVKFIVGCVYHIRNTPEFTLESMRIDSEQFDRLRLGPLCFIDHFPAFTNKKLQKISE